MGTYLTNEKMSPALRARIEVSVSGRRGPSRTLMTPRVRALIRIVVILAVVGVVTAVALQWRSSSHALEQAKAALLADVDQLQAKRPARAQPMVAAAQRWIAEAAAEYPGDHVDPSLRDPEQLQALLGRPKVYLRGPLSLFGTSSQLGRLEADPAMDSFVACLLSPPAGRAESDLLGPVEAAYRGGVTAGKETVQAHRLQDAILAQPFFGSAWRELVRSARTVSAVAKLRQTVARAQLERAVQAEHAEILIYLGDEPKKPGAASELDGANPHQVRVGIVDLTADSWLLRLRRPVDPSWISEAKRVYLARGLNACRLAVDLREELKPGEPD